MELRIAQIQVGERKRPVDLQQVAGLAASIRLLGLMNPITVDQDYGLVAGLHRLEACKLLGWESIPVTICALSDVVDTAALLKELAEIDENLIRNDLSELEKGLQHAERKRIYEQLHPEAKHGGDHGNQHTGGKQRQTDNMSTCQSYAADASAATGVTERTVRRNTHFGEILKPYRKELTGSAIEDNQSELLALAALVKKRPEQGQMVIAKLAEPHEAGKPITIKSLLGETKKAERIADIERQAATIAQGEVSVPTGPFHVISIDPPWPYGTDYDPATRRAANPYPEMSLEQIRALELPAAEDCVLWLWTTHQFMRHSFDLLDAWGFKDKAILTWVKDRMGLGSWLRSQSEFCIMAVKGRPPVQLTNQTTVINGPLREHSRKPDEFYALVEQLCVGAKLDYFSRQPREGWQQVGNTTELFGEAA